MAVSSAKSALRRAHRAFVFRRRVCTIAEHVAGEFPFQSRILDVGAGDGSVSAAVMRRRPDLVIEGIDVLLRRKTHIPVRTFDGRHFPFDDGSFSAVTFIDVLHHTENPGLLLQEAVRVARDVVVIKDHLCEGIYARATLRFMDWIGNWGHGVVLPYNYLTEREWLALFAAAGLQIDHWTEKLGLYPLPFSWIFERRLQFIARLSVTPKVLPGR